MKILITGARGFIGNKLCCSLSEKFKVHGISKKFQKRKYEVITHDLNKKIKIQQCYNFIIHAAAEIPLKYNKSSIFRSNVKMIKNILDFASKKKIHNLIFFSSMAVYDTKNKIKISEKNKLCIYKENNYALSKIECEKIIMQWLNQNKKNKALILRIPGIVGKGSHSNFVSNIVQNMTKRKKVNVFNSKSKFNNIVHIDTLINFIIDKILSFKNKFLVLNFGSKKPINIEKLVRIISEVLKYDFKKIKFLSSQDNSFLINFNKALKFGYKPLTVEQSLLKYLQEIKK